MDCLFCKIANKTLASNIVYEDEHALAFSDVAPQAPQHKLIIPKKHIPSINDLTEEDTWIMGHLVQVAKKLAKELGLMQSGYRLVSNCGKDANQSVFHIH